jgi:hypothetical protein
MYDNLSKISGCACTTKKMEFSSMLYQREGWYVDSNIVS